MGDAEAYYRALDREVEAARHHRERVAGPQKQPRPSPPVLLQDERETA